MAGKNGKAQPGHASAAKSKEEESSKQPSTTNAPRPSIIKGASLLIILQLTSRLITFAANQLLLRLLTAPLLGFSAQLEVYYLSVLFFARESLRVAIQRQGPAVSADENSQDAVRRESQAVVNLGYIAVVLGAVVSLALGKMYLGSANDDEALNPPHLVTAVWLYGLAAMIELLSEPCFVLMQTRLQFGTRALAESSATFLRCIVVFGSAVWASRKGLDLGVLPFALGQLCYGVVLVLVYLVSGYRLASSIGFSLLPTPAVRGEKKNPEFLGSYFYRPTLSLAGSMMAQSVVKHLLTQGDTLLVSFLSTPSVQGVYALANNYGGLLARLLFQPIEESSRSYFSRQLASVTPSEKQAPKPVTDARQGLHTLLRFYVLLSVLVLSLGPFAAPSLLAIVAGRRWVGSGAGEVLAAYCFYIPFLALNGIAESFVASVASEREVHKQSFWMGVFTVTFAAAAFLLMRVFELGAIGLVFANAINMLCRIVWSGLFIKRYFQSHNVAFGFRELVPGTALLLSATTSLIMWKLQIAEDPEQQPISKLARVVSFAVPLLVAL
ncbi:unnamed protein product [Clonostachys rosea f. rosea IK726]|uniref:Man(5)GlcNAc(2)-PP-dolichol translocation protein RFT1 n=2 Tax=Bionectria ochroleuca TaxID=29856 RepID=A0A0B7KL96_BIOOC|nr:unnamed protein product [Clonostachys rosea f. rosea IK726]